MLVQRFLEDSAARRPNHLALVCNGERLDYRQLDVMCARLTAGLQDASVQRGDRVVVYLPNCIEAVVSIFAALKAGGVFVVVNRTTKVAKLRDILNNCRATALVTDARALSQNPAAELAAAVPSLRTLVVCGSADGLPPAGPLQVRGYAGIQAGSSPRIKSVETIDLDLACLVYTSGTTGESKGVMCDHANIVFATGSIIEYLGNVKDDIVLNVLPLSFDYGLYQMLMTFRFGGTLVLENSFAFPEVILRLVETERVTGLPGVPTVFAMLLKMDLSAFDLSSLRYLTNTAAGLPPSHILELRRRFPHVALFSMYGLTETKRTLYLPPDQVEMKPESVGRAIPGTEVWIEGETGQRLGPGAVGELVARGRHVMRGYWKAPEASAERFPTGALPGERLCRTGDLFRMDDDGDFYFVGRKDDIIKSRGEKVAPKEVENVLHALDGVVEAAVVGVADPILGQAITAFIVRSREDLNQAEVLRFCRSRLEDFMVPKSVEFRDSIPKSPSGKIRKEDLV